MPPGTTSMPTLRYGLLCRLLQDLHGLGNNVLTPASSFSKRYKIPNFALLFYPQGGEQDQIDGPAIVRDANRVTSTMPSPECNKLRLELEMSGGMSNDHRIFPFRITGQESL